jgi:uncharacterized NAD(P)/FAD-binding protein YdhS
MYKTTQPVKKHIAIIGGGPSGLFVFKRLVEAGKTDIEVDIFEKQKELGAGMPYSVFGAAKEHITNVSDNEIPEMVNSVEDWIGNAPETILKRFHIDPDHFSEYKVMPRLLFGEYLKAQFDLLLARAKVIGLVARVHLNCKVIDISDLEKQTKVQFKTKDRKTKFFDTVVICTGHCWPKKHEGKIPGYYDSPYPPGKLKQEFNHPIAIRGSSLTAIDAISTIAHYNGAFTKNKQGKLSYKSKNPGFKIVMHSRGGMLPAVRFHLDDTHLHNENLLSDEEIALHIQENDGFLSLDFIFEKNFKEPLRDKEPGFYQQIKDLSLEKFVNRMMNMRAQTDPFELLKTEYAEAERSIKKRKSLYWKEMLGVLSFAMNYPAKHLSAEDMQRLHKVLIPLISIVIAYVPQSSCEELLALNDAGLLSMVTVDEQSRVAPGRRKGGATYHYTNEQGEKKSVWYQTFIDCTGQQQLSYRQLPFRSLLIKHTVSPAWLKFRSAKIGKTQKQKGNKNIKAEKDGNYYLNVPGLAINDSFQVLNPLGASNNRIYLIAVPYIGGLNPDYSGLDFCEEASARVAEAIKHSSSHLDLA